MSGLRALKTQFPMRQIDVVREASSSIQYPTSVQQPADRASSTQTETAGWTGRRVPHRLPILSSMLIFYDRTTLSRPPSGRYVMVDLDPPPACRHRQQPRQRRHGA